MFNNYIFTKFRRIIRVRKIYTDKSKNRPYSDVQGRFEVVILTYFATKSCIGRFCLYNDYSAGVRSAYGSVSMSSRNISMSS